MSGGRAGPLLGRELYAENADRDLGGGNYSHEKKISKQTRKTPNRQESKRAN